MAVRASSPRSALVAVALVLGSGCRSTTGERATSGSDAAHAPIDVDGGADAALVADAALAIDAAPSAPRRPLPTAGRLIAPFRDTTAHGFVAITDTDPALHPNAPRVIAPLVKGESVDPTRPVLVASFTKLWTAVAALRMVERGELSLDETVKAVLPDLASRPWATSTLKELLTHTSLVPELDEKGGYYRRNDVDFSSPVTVLARHIPRDWTEKQGIYKYRNSELALVGAMLAERTKLPADRLLAREVWGPAGMAHAGLLVTADAPPELDLAPMGPIRPRNFFTAGAGYASVVDLLAFFEALAGDKLLTARSKALLFDGAKERGNGALGCWAYPFARASGGTTLLVERPGSFGNVRLFTAFFPEEQRAIVAWTGDGIDLARPSKSKGIGAALARAALE
jgi:CubicO group peptidase (beta-lactamase class C family)